MAKGFADYGGVLINIRVQPKIRAEVRQAARALGCTAADLYREAVEAWLVEYRKNEAE